ncbi:MAG: hypothetical protein Q9183_004992, partial [Haloplaca sp. 2 TL-2023]
PEPPAAPPAALPVLALRSSSIIATAVTTSSSISSAGKSRFTISIFAFPCIDVRTFCSHFASRSPRSVVHAYADPIIELASHLHCPMLLGKE